MRLLQIAELFELGERVAHRCRRHAQPGALREARRADRLGGIDVFTDERSENLRGPWRKVGSSF